MEGQKPEQTGSPTWLPPQLERRPTFESLSPGSFSGCIPVLDDFQVSVFEQFG